MKRKTFQCFLLLSFILAAIFITGCELLYPPLFYDRIVNKPALKYTVTFDSQGATVPASPGSKTVTPPATTIDALPADPSLTAYIFSGWYTAPGGGGTAFTAGTPVTADITVYALWTSVGASWTARGSLPTTGWSSIAYGNGVFVAVGSGTTASAYSLDGGVTWTASSTLSTGPWTSVTYGNGRFVAVASGTLSAASTDGINWTSNNTLPSYNWSSVTWGSSGFIAVASGSTATAISIDGTSWSPGGSLPGNSSWSSIAYGKGVYVVVNPSMSVISPYSTDGGASWLPPSGLGPYTWIAVTFGNNFFAAITIGDQKAAFSPDGTNWSVQLIPGTHTWKSVTYGSGVFVAVAQGSQETAISIDNGTTWTLGGNLPSTQSWCSVAFGNGRFVAVASDSATAVTLP